MSGVVTVSAGLVGGGLARVNRSFLKVRVIAREIRVKGINDRAIGLQSAITSGRNH